MPSCFLLGFFLFASSISLQATAESDVVHFKDGTVQEGQLVELGGNAVEFLLQGASKKVLKKDIESVDFSKSRHSSEIQSSDAVIKRGGHTIRGEVKLVDGGQKVEVTLPGGSKAVFLRKDVLRIVKRGESMERDTTVYTLELEKSIVDALSTLHSRSSEASDSPEEKLLSSCGILAIQQVREALSKAPAGSAEAKTLARIERLHRLKEAVASELEEAESRVYEILSAGQDREKCDLLVFLFPRFVDESTPLAEFLATDPMESPVVRAWAVDFLRRMQKNRELVEIYRHSTGQVQMACAVALGKNRILIGVPTLLEGLEFEGIELRELASKHLREFTGQDFRFRPDGSPQARKEAVARWRAWWQKNKEELCRQAETVLRGEGLETKERAAAAKLWKEGCRRLEKKDLADAQACFRKAMETDPGFIQAPLSLAVLLYSELQKPQEAVTILNDLKSKSFTSSARDEDRQWINLYLGHSLRLSGNLEGAADAYRQCLAHSRDNLQATLALGDIYSQEATSQKELKPEERKEKLKTALESYRLALSLLDKLSQDLTTLRFEELPTGIELPFDRREYNRSVVDLRKKYRRQKEEVRLRAAKTLALLGEKKEAIVTLKSALEDLALDPLDPSKKLEADLRTHLGLLYEDLGQPVLALKEFRKVLKDLDASSSESREGIERLRRQQAKSEDHTGN